MHRRHLVVSRVGLVQVERLRLANVWSTADSEVKQLFLRDLPNGLVKLLKMSRDL